MGDIMGAFQTLPGVQVRLENDGRLFFPTGGEPSEVIYIDGMASR